MYQIILRMYLRFQSSFRGGEQPPITSQGFVKEQMNHGKGNRGLACPRIGCTKFF